MIKLILLSVLLLLPVTATSKDYGLGHTIPVAVAAHVLPELNAALFKDQPEFAKVLTKVELAVVVWFICDREAEARGSWRIAEWHEQTGSYDSTFDCLTPAGYAGFNIIEDGFTFDIINIKW